MSGDPHHDPHHQEQEGQRDEKALVAHPIDIGEQLVTGDEGGEVDLPSPPRLQWRNGGQPPAALRHDLESSSELAHRQLGRQLPIGRGVELGQPRHRHLVAGPQTTHWHAHLGNREGDDAGGGVEEGDLGRRCNALPGEPGRKIGQREIGADDTGPVRETPGEGEPDLAGGEEDVEIRGDRIVATDRLGVPFASARIEVGGFERPGLEQADCVIEEEQRPAHRHLAPALDALHGESTALRRIEPLRGDTTIAHRANQEEITVLITDEDRRDIGVQAQGFGQRMQRLEPLLERGKGQPPCLRGDVDQTLRRLIELGDGGLYMAADAVH